MIEFFWSFLVFIVFFFLIKKSFCYYIWPEHYSFFSTLLSNDFFLGQILLGQIHEAQPFSNTLETILLQGRYLRQTLEISAASHNVEEPDGAFLQVSGRVRMCDAHDIITVIISTIISQNISNLYDLYVMRMKRQTLFCFYDIFKLFIERISWDIQLIERGKWLKFSVYVHTK